MPGFTGNRRAKPAFRRRLPERTHQGLHCRAIVERSPADRDAFVPGGAGFAGTSAKGPGGAARKGRRASCKGSEASRETFFVPPSEPPSPERSQYVGAVPSTGG